MSPPMLERPPLPHYRIALILTFPNIFKTCEVSSVTNLHSAYLCEQSLSMAFKASPSLLRPSGKFQRGPRHPGAGSGPRWIPRGGGVRGAVRRLQRGTLRKRAGPAAARPGIARWWARDSGRDRDGPRGAATYHSVEPRGEGPRKIEMWAFVLSWAGRFYIEWVEWAKHSARYLFGFMLHGKVDALKR